MNHIELNVQGMTCGSCVKHVDAALRQLAGVSAVEVDLNAGRVRVTGSPAIAAVLSALEQAGYPAQQAASAASSAKPANNAGKSGCCCH